MAVLAAVVGYALPSVKDEPRRLPSWGYRLLALVGAGLAVASLGVFGPTLEGVAAAVFCLALAVVTAADLDYRLIPNRVVLPASVLVLALMTAVRRQPGVGARRPGRRRRPASSSRSSTRQAWAWAT